MRPRTAPTRIVGYIRVSTDKQASEGNSLEAQRARLEAYATAMQLEIVAFEVDAGLSAKSLVRPGLQRALARLDAFEADAILVVKLDRLTRSVRDLLTLIDTYFRDGQHELLSIGESIDTRSAAGRMILKILTTIGEWEREAIGERTAAVMQHMKSQGEFTGGWPPFGYRVVDGRLEPDAIEQALIERARAFRSAGMSLRAVAAELGPNNRTGRAFDPKQIARML
jgi:site-specific DNA recombinase